jgi:class 3 adenylate cyclase
MPPVTRYVAFDGVRVAYQVFGKGPVDVVMSAGSFSHTDVLWEDPAAALFLTRLASFARVIRYDRLGTSNSDPLPAGWESTALFARELETVLAAAGAREVVLIAMLDAGPFAIQYAASKPDRVRKLILYNTTARFEEADDYPIGLASTALADLLEHIDSLWGTDAQVAINVPSHVGDEHFAAWYGKFVRAIGTPTAIGNVLGQNLAVDARADLHDVPVPTLVIHRIGYTLVPLSHGHYAAAQIPESMLVELPGHDGPVYWETPDLILGHIRDFIARDAPSDVGATEFATIVFSDIVRSTEMAEAMGDRDWSAVVDVHQTIAAAAVERRGGRLVKWTGDGILAVFPDPSLALAGAEELRANARALGTTVRVGVHSGGIEVSRDDVTGLAVHIAARVMATAGDDEIVVSRTVRDLMLGSAHRFRDLGPHALKGIEGSWELYALESHDPFSL